MQISWLHLECEGIDASWWHEISAKHSRTSANRFKNVIMLPSNEMEETATSDDYNSNHFQDATLLCSLIFQKQESREMSHTNLTGLIRKNLKGGTLSLFSL